MRRTDCVKEKVFRFLPSVVHNCYETRMFMGVKNKTSDECLAVERTIETKQFLQSATHQRSSRNKDP